MEIEILIALVVFAFVMSVTPGPNNLMLMASGTNFGFKRSLPHMMGITFGFIVLFIFVGFGAVELFSIVPMSYTIFKILSMTYMLYLIGKILFSAFKHVEQTGETSHVKPFNFIQALLFQWVNPKAWVMAVTAISTYMSSLSSVYSVLLIAVVFGVIMFPSISVWVLLGVKLQKFLDHPMKRKVFNIAVALLLLASIYPLIFDANISFKT